MQPYHLTSDTSCTIYSTDGRTVVGLRTKTSGAVIASRALVRPSPVMFAGGAGIVGSVRSLPASRSEGAGGSKRCDGDVDGYFRDQGKGGAGQLPCT